MSLKYRIEQRQYIYHIIWCVWYQDSLIPMDLLFDSLNILERASSQFYDFAHVCLFCGTVQSHTAAAIAA